MHKKNLLLGIIIISLSTSIAAMESSNANIPKKFPLPSKTYSNRRMFTSSVGTLIGYVLSGAMFYKPQWFGDAPFWTTWTTATGIATLTTGEVFGGIAAYMGKYSGDYPVPLNKVNTIKKNLHLLGITTTCAGAACMAYNSPSCNAHLSKAWKTLLSVKTNSPLNQLD